MQPATQPASVACVGDPDAVVPFADVDPFSPFCPDIAWLTEQRITSGRADGAFGAGDELTRGQMAAFLHRLAGEPAPGPTAMAFPDVGPGDTFAVAIEWLSGEGITSGRVDGSFGPHAELSRAQMATFLRCFDAVVRPEEPEQVTSEVWQEVPHDPAVFGVAGEFELQRVASGAGGVVAVGRRQ